MPYVGGSVTVFFDKPAQELTKATAHRLCDAGVSKAREVARINTPVDTGRLRAAWYSTEVKRAGDTCSGDIVNDTDYAGYVEDGTGLWGPNHAPYVIRAKPGGYLRWVGKDGQVHFAKMVTHPGSPGNHMLKIGLNVAEGLLPAYAEGIVQFWARGVEELAERQV